MKKDEDHLPGRISISWLMAEVRRVYGVAQERTITEPSLSWIRTVLHQRLPNVADCMVREGASNDFETDPESQHAVEIFNWQFITASIEAVS